MPAKVNDNQRDGFAWRHDQAQQTDRDGRQALAEDALDEAGENEGNRRNGDKET
jgi:hypothetical protein